MPPKTVTCGICNTVVLKAQTYARTDGIRACRSHEGVADEAKKRVEAERARARQATTRGAMITRPAVTEALRAVAEFRDYVNSHCWICSDEGISASQYLCECMIAIQRLQLRGEFNFLKLPEQVRELVGNVKALFALPYKDETIDRAIVKHIKDRRVRDVIHVLTFIRICQPCIVKHGYQARFEALLPKPTFEQLAAMTPIVEMVEPLLTELAEQKERQS